MKQIEFTEDTCILTMDSNGDFKMYIPAPEEGSDAQVPLPIIFMTAIGLLIAKDDELFKYVMSRLDEILINHLNGMTLDKDANELLDFFATNIDRLKEKKDG